MIDIINVDNLMLCLNTIISIWNRTQSKYLNAENVESNIQEIRIDEYYLESQPITWFHLSNVPGFVTKTVDSILFNLISNLTPGIMEFFGLLVRFVTDLYTTLNANSMDIGLENKTWKVILETAKNVVSVFMF